MTLKEHCAVANIRDVKALRDANQRWRFCAPAGNLDPRGELVQEPFQRLAAACKLLSYAYDGFRALSEDMHAHGLMPWEIWKSSP